LKKKRYTLYEADGSLKRRWKKIVFWSAVALVVLVLAAIGGSYLWFRAEVSSANARVTPEIRAALEDTPSSTLTTEAPPVSSSVSSATSASSTSTASSGTTLPVEPSPSAMNILVLGSDRRAKDPSGGGRSDTIMVVHIDPDRNYLSVLSLPRDLRVNVPGHGMAKLNTAFAYGGPALAIKTIKQTTGININHYLEVGFDSFASIVDSLGGVYLDVDQRYFSDGRLYEAINLYPGYQLLGGADALDYVRYRHDRNGDFGRMERQQRFMTAVREQAMGWNLPFKLPGLISTLFGNVTTDLGANDILKLASWGIRLSGDNIRTITLRGTTPTINGQSFVVVSDTALAKAVGQLLDSSSPWSPSEGTTATSSPATTKPTDATTGAPAATPGTIPDAKVWEQTAAGVPFAVQAPAYLPSGYAWTSKMPAKQPTYDIKVGGGTKPAFRMLYALDSNRAQVMGITETTWLNPPAASKGLEVTHDGTVFTVVRNGQNVERVWWKADGVLYWVSNSLSHLLDQNEMLKIAESMIAVPGQ
jgi:LCP family protein required for cell wall assembly